MHNEFGNSLEHILGRVGRKVGNQFVVNGQIGRQHKEVADAAGQVQITDKRTHQPGFADAGSQGKTERRKFTFKVFHRGKFALDGCHQSSCINPFAGRSNFGDAMENFQRMALRRPQAQAAGYGVNVSVHWSTSF